MIMIKFGKMKSPVNGDRQPARRHKSRAQSLVETAMVLPILILFLGILVDAGLALNVWLRVNTAARDATRFALDAGRSSDIDALVRDKLSGIGSDPIDIYMIKGQTTNAGVIADSLAPYWGVTTVHSSGTRSGPSIQRSTVQADLAKGMGSSGANNTIYFVIVEVDVNYTPLIAQLIAPNLRMPMSSYAIIQRANDE